MKILLLSTYKSQGGAAIACYRIFQALKARGADVKLLVFSGEAEEDVQSMDQSKFGKKRRFFNFAFERLYFTMFEKSKDVRFAFSPSNVGVDISTHPWVKEADVINLHWVHHGFLSLGGIKKILRLNKKVCWTLHDMWLFTGGCHYSGICEAYKTTCGNCPFLARQSKRDLSNRIYRRKEKIFLKSNFTVITPSKWLKDEADSATLLDGKNVLNIPNPLDPEIFKPLDREKARRSLGLPLDKKLILFIAEKVDDERKGFKYLKEAIDFMILESPEFSKNIEILLMGNIKDESAIDFKLPTNKLGRISEISTIVEIFSAADLFLAPSLEDNLPNTIVEATACGLPVVAFKTGGIPEIITHHYNGYIAEQRDFKDLKYGIEWVLDMSDEDYGSLRNNARTQSALFTPHKVAKAYLEAFGA